MPADGFYDQYVVTDPGFEVEVPEPSLSDIYNNVDKDTTNQMHFFNKDFDIYTNRESGDNSNPRYRW